MGKFVEPLEKYAINLVTNEDKEIISKQRKDPELNKKLTLLIIQKTMHWFIVKNCTN